ncbi:MAG TPA: hypothetical protein VF018_04580, partial [Acidobacteriaceae bacterium]
MNVGRVFHRERVAISMVAMSQGLFPRILTVGFLLLGSMLAAVAQTGHNPILPGDHPDPSIIRTGKTYWTTSTSGDRTPLFPL